MAGPTSFFDMGHRAMSAQLVRMNTAASNLANAGSVAGSEAEAYRPVYKRQGDVWEAPVDENAEMVEMLEASRQYSNMVEALSTAKQLMLETMRMK